MALTKETADKLSAFGLDVQALTDAIKDEEEKTIELPELFTKDQFETFGKNRFKEGKDAFSEIKAKELKEKFNIELEGKDLDKVIEAHINSQVSEASKGKDEWINDKKTLQQAVKDAEKKVLDITREYENKIFNFGVTNELKSLLPSDVPISGDLIIKSFMIENSVVKGDDGSAVIKKGDSILKDQMRNPVSAKDHFKAWLDLNNIKSVKGSEGGDSGGGSSTPKFESISQFTDWAIKKGLNPSDEDAQKILSENQTDNFKFE